MPELQKHRNPRTIQPNCTTLGGTLTIGAAGAISAQTDTRNSGVTFVKNAAAGRYDATIHRAYRRAIDGDANVQFPTAGTVPTGTDGNEAYLQGIAAAAWAGTAGFSTFTIQCVTSNGTPAAANPASGTIVSWELVVSDSP
jgi:hypothetical protein